MRKLKIETVDNIFRHLGGVYGVDFVSQYKYGKNPDASYKNAKDIWAEALSDFVDFEYILTPKIEYLPKSAPNLVTFREICMSVKRRIQEDVNKLQYDKQAIDDVSREKNKENIDNIKKILKKVIVYPKDCI